MDRSSLADVFRFVQIRPPRPADDVETIALLDPDLARLLGATVDTTTRISLANQALVSEERTVRSLDELDPRPGPLAQQATPESTAAGTRASLGKGRGKVAEASEQAAWATIASSPKGP